MASLVPDRVSPILLTVFLCTFDMLLDIFIVHRWLDSWESLHNSVKADWCASEKLMLNIHRSHVGAFRI